MTLSDPPVILGVGRIALGGNIAWDWAPGDCLPFRSPFLVREAPVALWPCMRCKQRFTGEAQNVYATWFLGDEREAYRYVVCQICVDALLEEWRDGALQRSTEGDWVEREPEAPPIRSKSSPARPQWPRAVPERPGDLPWR